MITVTEPAPALAVPKTFLPPVALGDQESLPARITYLKIDQSGKAIWQPAKMCAVAIEPQHFTEGTLRHTFIAVSRRAMRMTASQCYWSAVSAEGQEKQSL